VAVLSLTLIAISVAVMMLLRRFVGPGHLSGPR